MAAIRSSRVASTMSRPPRRRLDQSGIPAGTTEEGMIVLGAQPDEQPPPPEEPPAEP